MSLERRGGSPDELKRLIAESYAGGHIDPGEAGMLTGVFHLHEQEARQVMTPIPAVVTIDISQDVETALQLCISSGHTRLVVTESEDRDRVRGLVHASMLARQLMRRGTARPVEPIVHDAPIVPETKPLDDLLADLQRERTSMAVVVDEYGRVVGHRDGRGHHRGGRGGDRRRDRSRRRARSAGSPTATGSCAGTWPSPTWPTTASTCPWTPTPTTRSAASCSPSSAGCPGAGDTVNVDGFSIRVESVRENRVEAVRIRERRPAPPRESATRAAGAEPGR